MTQTPVTKVVFRKFKNDGSIIALFPEIEEYGGSISSYMHVGQHSAASYYGCVIRSTLATETEYAPLKRELESIGYSLKVIKKFTRK
jgi:hypothetical protein